MHDTQQGTLGLEVQRVWEAHAEAIKAADEATVFGHPCVKVMYVYLYVCMCGASVIRSRPPIHQPKHKHKHAQACQFYQRLLTCPEAAVIAVGLGHVLVGILRRLSMVCVYLGTQLHEIHKSAHPSPPKQTSTGQRRLVPRHARPHALQPGGPHTRGGQGPCCPRVVCSPPLRRAAGAGGGGARGAAAVGRVWWRWW